MILYLFFFFFLEGWGILPPFVCLLMCCCFLFPAFVFVELPPLPPPPPPFLFVFNLLYIIMMSGTSGCCDKRVAFYHHRDGWRGGVFNRVLEVAEGMAAALRGRLLESVGQHLWAVARVVALATCAAWASPRHGAERCKRRVTTSLPSPVGGSRVPESEACNVCSVSKPRGMHQFTTSLPSPPSRKRGAGKRGLKWGHGVVLKAELRGCVNVEVAVLGSPGGLCGRKAPRKEKSLRPNRSTRRDRSSGAVRKSRWPPRP